MPEKPVSGSIRNKNRLSEEIPSKYWLGKLIGPQAFGSRFCRNSATLLYKSINAGVAFADLAHVR
jgi:hypothetical protein